MRELIKIKSEIIGDVTVNSINARDLYLSLSIKQQFSDWIKKQINSLGLEENIDYITFKEKIIRESGGGTTKIEYIITTDTAKHISMASRTLKGKEMRNYFIEIEKKFNKNEELPKLSGRIAGLTSGNVRLRKIVEKLKKENQELKEEQLLLPYKSLEENIDTLVYQTLKELKADTRRLDFFQNRANYFAKYVNILRSTGTKQQKYTITEIDRYKNESIKAQKEVVEVQQKLENLQKVVDDYTNISNIMLKTRYVS